jgi:hypothetical protein
MPEDIDGALDDVTDTKALARLRKLLAGMGVPADVREVTFRLDADGTVTVLWVRR